MSTTKKTTSKKAAPRKKTVNRDKILKDIQKIQKLRDSIYKNYNGRCANSYSKDKFKEALNHLADAAYKLSEVY